MKADRFLKIKLENNGALLNIKLCSISGEEFLHSNSTIINKLHRDLIDPTLVYISSNLEGKLDQLFKLFGLLELGEAEQMIFKTYPVIVNALLNRLEDEKCLLTAFNKYYRVKPDQILVNNYLVLIKYFRLVDKLDLINYYTESLNHEIMSSARSLFNEDELLVIEKNFAMFKAHLREKHGHHLPSF